MKSFRDENGLKTTPANTPKRYLKRISKNRFYGEGGLTNSNLMRMANTSGKWKYYIIIN